MLSSLPPELIPFTQILIALAFGMVLGIERVISGRVAGPRTYGLVSMGACLATLLSIEAVNHYPTPVDPIPIINSIIIGVGFIGAGLIVLHGARLSGLTTAAGIWVSAIIGIAVGFQVYLLALFTTIVTFLVFSIMSRVERKLKERYIKNFPGTGPEPESE